MSDSPCWTGEIDWSCCDTIPPSGAQRDLIEQMAIYFLWAATGRKYGLCERTYRPCRRTCGSYWGGLPFPMRNFSGEWVNLRCGTCAGACSCATVSEVVIPNVDSVVAIREDGIDTDPCTAVAVYDRRRIIRTDGNDWPMCQNLSSVDGAGTWSITVMQGWPWPPGFAYIAGLLACELQCVGSDACRLPKRIQTLTRQGVTVGFQDAFDGLATLRVGIWEIDAWIESARYADKRSASVVSPDVPRPSVLTWPSADDCTGG